jgi:hypothetical protein
MHLEIATIKMRSMTLLEQHDVFRSGKHRNIALFRSFSSIQSRDFYAHHVLSNCRQDEAGARSSLHRRTDLSHSIKQRMAFPTVYCGGSHFDRRCLTLRTSYLLGKLITPLVIKRPPALSSKEAITFESVWVFDNLGSQKSGLEFGCSLLDF